MEEEEKRPSNAMVSARLSNARHDLHQVETFEMHETPKDYLFIDAYFIEFD